MVLASWNIAKMEGYLIFFSFLLQALIGNEGTDDDLLDLEIGWRLGCELSYFFFFFLKKNNNLYRITKQGTKTRILNHSCGGGLYLESPPKSKVLFPSGIFYDFGM